MVLSIPRPLRNPARGIFKADEPMKKCIYFLWADSVRYTKEQMPEPAGWTQEIDYAEVLSGNTGLSLTWTPYQHNNWLLSFLGNAISFGLGFIPIAGPFLATGCYGSGRVRRRQRPRFDPRGHRSYHGFRG